MRSVLIASFLRTLACTPVQPGRWFIHFERHFQSICFFLTISCLMLSMLMMKCAVCACHVYRTQGRYGDEIQQQGHEGRERVSDRFTFMSVLVLFQCLVSALVARFGTTHDASSSYLSHLYSHCSVTTAGTHAAQYCPMNVSVSLSACSYAYLGNRTSQLHQISCA